MAASQTLPFRRTASMATVMLFVQLSASKTRKTSTPLAAASSTKRSTTLSG